MRLTRSSEKKPLKYDEFEAPGRCDGFDKLIRFTSDTENIHPNGISQALEPEIIDKILEPVARILHERAIRAKNKRERKQYDRQEGLFYRLTQWVCARG